MAITRYENVDINNVTNGTDAVGEYTTTIAKWFTSRALIADVANSVRISERYRVYQDLVNLTFNYTPNIKDIVDKKPTIEQQRKLNAGTFARSPSNGEHDRKYEGVH